MKELEDLVSKYRAQREEKVRWVMEVLRWNYPIKEANVTPYTISNQLISCVYQIIVNCLQATNKIALSFIYLTLSINTVLNTSLVLGRRLGNTAFMQNNDKATFVLLLLLFSRGNCSFMLAAYTTAKRDILIFLLLNDIGGLFVCIYLIRWKIFILHGPLHKTYCKQAASFFDEFFFPIFQTSS